MAKVKAKRKNIYFRQTPKEFSSARQTQVFSHINRNIPQRIYTFSKEKFQNTIKILNNKFNKISTKPPKNIGK